MSGSLVFLLGHPVSHSLSPLIQNAAFAWAGYQARYELRDVPEEELDATLEALENDLQVDGCNVTVPHKTGVFRWLEAHGRFLGESARLAGAVNTLWRNPDGAWCGDSTDFDGFLHDLRKNGPVKEAGFDAWLAGRDAAVLGSGGAARTVARGLGAMKGGPRELHVFARSPARAEGMVPAARIHALADFPAWNRGRPSLVVQATTVGMESGPMAGCSPVPADAMEPGQTACDIVYKPHETPFLRDAAARGASTVHGIGMLVGQGAVSCRHWLGEAGIAKDIFPLMDVMEQALKETR